MRETPPTPDMSDTPGDTADTATSASNMHPSDLTNPADTNVATGASETGAADDDNAPRIPDADPGADTPTSGDMPTIAASPPVESPALPPLRLPPRPAPARAWRMRLLTGAGVTLLACVMLGLLTDGGQLMTPSAQAHITPSPRPTATNTSFPIPTPAEGFQVYVDRSDGFIIQYPGGWAPKPLPPAIVFADDQNSPNYIVQVLQPSAFTSVSGNANPNDPNVWVDYELTNLARQWPQNDFARTTISTRTQIGGVTWQCGVGLVAASVAPTVTPQATATSTPGAATTPTAPTSALTGCRGNSDSATDGSDASQAAPGATPSATSNTTATPSVPDRCLVSTCIRVEVYATVYNGRPYIITLLASDDRFAAGSIEFFQPMLQSYEFLPGGSTGS
ncbi:MAG: PsbP-related protein [Ktedonobacterales bacterium]